MEELWGILSISEEFLLCHVDGLVQDRSNSIANTMELLQSNTKPSILSFDCSNNITMTS